MNFLDVFSQSIQQGAEPFVALCALRLVRACEPGYPLLFGHRAIIIGVDFLKNLQKYGLLGRAGDGLGPGLGFERRRP